MIRSAITELENDLKASTSIKIEAASAFYPKTKETVDSQNLNCSIEMKSTTEAYSSNAKEWIIKILDNELQGKENFEVVRGKRLYKAFLEN